VDCWKQKGRVAGNWAVSFWKLGSGLLETGQWTAGDWKRAAGNWTVDCWKLDSALLETGKGLLENGQWTAGN
jgi:hypothetical protein